MDDLQKSYTRCIRSDAKGLPEHLFVAHCVAWLQLPERVLMKKLLATLAVVL